MKRVLVVDKDVSSAVLVEQALLLLGCEVTSVHDGCTAVKASIGQSFDAAVIDVDMADCDGLASVEAIRMVDREARIVVVGTGDAARICEAARSVQAHGCVRKPIDVNEIAMMLSTVLAQESCKDCCQLVS